MFIRAKDIDTGGLVYGSWVFVDDNGSTITFPQASLGLPLANYYHTVDPDSIEYRFLSKRWKKLSSLFPSIRQSTEAVIFCSMPENSQNSFASTRILKVLNKEQNHGKKPANQPNKPKRKHS